MWIRMSLFRSVAVVALLCASACPSSGPSGPSQGPKPAAGAADDTTALAKKSIVPPLSAERAPSASPRLANTPEPALLQTRIASYFAGHVGRRIYLQIDKPLYKPGETVWVRSWNLRARDLGGDATGPSTPGAGLGLGSAASKMMKPLPLNGAPASMFRA